MELIKSTHFLFWARLAPPSPWHCPLRTATSDSPHGARSLFFFVNRASPPPKPGGCASRRAFPFPSRTTRNAEFSRHTPSFFPAPTLTSLAPPPTSGGGSIRRVSRPKETLLTLSSPPELAVRCPASTRPTHGRGVAPWKACLPSPRTLCSTKTT